MCSVMSYSFQPHGLQPTRLLCPGDFPGKNTCLGFSRQEYWSGLPFPPPGDVLDSEFEPASPVSPTLQADTLPLSHWGSPLYTS